MTGTVLRHIVLFRIRDSVDGDALASTMAQLRQLGALDMVLELAVGPDISRRGTFDVGLTADFRDETDLRRYLAHPAHGKLVETLPQIFERPWEVVDYWVRCAPSHGGRPS